MSSYIGIDPGIKGALAHVVDGRLVAVVDMPTVEVRGKHKIQGRAVRDWFVNEGPVSLVVMEEVGAMPGNGNVAMFNFGVGVGQIHGILDALDRSWMTVRPQAWTKRLAVGSDKGFHRQTAQRLFPESAHLFKRVKDDGRADAALLAFWAASAPAVPHDSITREED